MKYLCILRYAILICHMQLIFISLDIESLNMRHYFYISKFQQ